MRARATIISIGVERILYLHVSIFIFAYDRRRWGNRFVHMD